MDIDDVKRITIKDFFNNGSLYNVPIYQRKYVWTEETIQQLFDDFKILLGEEKKTLYFGNILIKRENSSLVDGQQRITTFLIFFKALLDDYKERITRNNYDEKTIRDLERLIYIEENDKLKKRVKIQDKLNIKKFDDLFNDYENIKLLYSKSDLWKNKSIYHKNYYKFRKLIREFIDESIFDTKDFIELFKRIWIIKINLNQSDDELKIFETLNSKGTILEAIDLIKNYYFLKLPNFEEGNHNATKSKIREFFEETIFNVINKSWGKSIENEIKKFIKEYIIFKSAKHNLKKDEEFASYKTDKLTNLSLPEEKNSQDLYIKFKLVTETEFNNLKNDEEIENSINDLEKFLLMKKITKECQNDSDYSWEAYRSSLMIFNEIYTGSQFFPIIAQLLEKEIANIEAFEINDVSIDFKKSIMFLESLIVRRNSVGQGTRLLTRTINKIHIDNFKDLVSEFENLNVEDFEFKQGLQKENFFSGNSTNVIKSMLWRFELNEFKTRNNETINQMGDKRKITVEHIMPQNLNEKWKDDLGFDWEEKHQKYVNSIGNLTITANNSKLGNKDFDTIKKEYFKEGIIFMNRKIAESNKWTDREIVARTEIMVKKALEIWKILMN